MFPLQTSGLYLVGRAGIESDLVGREGLDSDLVGRDSIQLELHPPNHALLLSTTNSYYPLLAAPVCVRTCFKLKILKCSTGLLKAL